MRISRVYVEFPLASEQVYALSADTVHYLTRVLRLKNGAELILFDGAGDEYPATLNLPRGGSASACTGTACSPIRESSLSLTLALAVCRGERMDFAVQKAVELGVHRIVPLMTEFTVVRLGGERARRRTSHWRKVVIHACEQCGRTRIPELLPVMPLAEYLATPACGRQQVLLDPAAQPLSMMTSSTTGTDLLIGPEGGLSEAEVAAARQAGWMAMGLGPRILRAETAVVAGLTALQLLQGDFGDQQTG